ncbi:hypothetical protein CONLIGDRAFT_665762 [Coniochaeta ligniaria NRRL 30616]|uniref:Uncharacterized protein n=1 Tax=Coniochaeta ligniaria NRRL 30616 TaxID=1408157 RepID=A0A1J7J4Q2_9PEZI|nr:hypothetical protein CONLIGDRAFT_665762 [Coniochaeta ligniaria NRRL 30616]
MATSTASRTAACHGPEIRHDNFVPRSFKRIRLAIPQDFDTCYGIVAGYLRHPEAAYSVEECILHPPRRGHRAFTGLLRGPPADIVDDSMQERIMRHAQSLGLGDELTLKLSEALDLNKPQFNDGELTMNYTNYGFYSAVATLLISLCPNIVTLRIYGVDLDTPLGQLLLKNNYGMLAKPVLQKLREVQLHPVNCMDEREYARIQSVDHIRYFHRLPAIDRLSMEGLEEYDAEIEFFPPKSSHGIKEIRMSHVDMSAEMVGTIIRIPKTLEKYSLSTNGLQNQYDHESTLDAETLARCLSEHKDWLTELDIDAAVCWPSDHEVDVFEEEWKVEQMSKWYFVLDQRDGSSDLPLRLEDVPATRDYPARSIGSLADFRALKRLSIRIGLLLGYDDTKATDGYRLINRLPTHVPSARRRLIDVLPASLEFLRLYGYKKGDYADVDSHVAELLERKSELFPNLGEIEGVDEFLPGVPGTYDVALDDEEVWIRPEENLNWAED